MSDAFLAVALKPLIDASNAQDISSFLKAVHPIDISSYLQSAINLAAQQQSTSVESIASRLPMGPVSHCIDQISYYHNQCTNVAQQHSIAHFAAGFIGQAIDAATFDVGFGVGKKLGHWVNSRIKDERLREPFSQLIFYLNQYESLCIQCSNNIKPKSFDMSNYDDHEKLIIYCVGGCAIYFIFCFCCCFAFITFAPKKHNKKMRSENIGFSYITETTPHSTTTLRICNVASSDSQSVANIASPSTQ